MTPLTELAVVTTATARHDLARLFDALTDMQASLALRLRVVVVDDIGVWASAQQANAFTRNYPALNTTVLRHDTPVGQFAAMLEGVLMHRHLDTLLIDPDMHGCLAGGEALVAALGQADIVHCVRRQRPDIGPLRRLGSRLVNMLLRRITGLQVPDLQSPMMLLSARVLASLPQAMAHPGNPRLYLYREFRHRIVCLPVDVRLPPDHRSHYTLAHLARLAVQVVADAWRLRS